jgi:hypothetical protein
VPLADSRAERRREGDVRDVIAWILLAVGVLGIVSSSLLWTTWARTRPLVAPA